MLDVLCGIIRETGASDSAAAARAGLHPSTVSRWKREVPDFAILLRSAREEFRQVHLDIIQREADSGRATGWRASVWILERIFPEDYAPRAKERARFQELYEAKCAGEGEGGEVALPDLAEPWQNVQNPRLRAASDRSEVLQNVQNPRPLAATDRSEVLQNVQNSGRA